MNNRKKGYDWEDQLVKKFQRAGWFAVRLGSPSPFLPDVLAINNNEGRLVAIEAKSSSRDYISVRAEQLDKIVKFMEEFAAYKKREAVLAVKFLMVPHRRKREELFFRLKGRGFPKNLHIAISSDNVLPCLEPWKDPFSVNPTPIKVSQ
ncbi:MAG: hypothetical protein JRN19_06300 [Nitrososphaerota archaeon]|nr:hypothetical protein [Nitrososphaerota archaeon]MDG7047917.1 hypothetical protein [Nitrososphaerota archaeon]MDG7049007.1 hypothetical protein [Nitrososphaerota archaeon]MDG7052042.1 hypothetical protein [Nitrososphaerota archaeon]